MRKLVTITSIDGTRLAFRPEDLRRVTELDSDDVQGWARKGDVQIDFAGSDYVLVRRPFDEVLALLDKACGAES